MHVQYSYSKDLKFMDYLYIYSNNILVKRNGIVNTEDMNEVDNNSTAIVKRRLPI